MPQLSIVCVSRLEHFAGPFLEEMSWAAGALDAEFVLALDRVPSGALTDLHLNWQALPKVVSVESHGYVESVLDHVLEHATGEYILRLDDDEKCSQAMFEWLENREYRAAAHWKFPTANLWGDENSVLTMPPLWPDPHTRLSRKQFAGGRHHPHAGSPYGGGEYAPVIHEHHKFLVKTRAEREIIAARYDAIGEGYGTGDGLRPFSLPETCYEEFTLAPLGDGHLREWAPEELRVVKP